MLSMRNIRPAVGMILSAISISAAVHFAIWPKMLTGLTTNIGLAPHSWLTIRIILISLILPGLLCMAWAPTRRLLVSTQRLIDGLSDRIFLFIVLSLAAMARIIATVIMPLRLWADWDTYHRLALLWAATGEYTIGQQPTAFFPPGWPFFLSRLYLVFGGMPEVGNVANIVLGVAIVYLGFRITRKIWETAAARWTAIVLAIFPSQVLFTHLLCSEILFTFLFLISINVLLGRSTTPCSRYLRCFLSGIFLGATTLTRSLTLALPLALIPFFLKDYRGKMTASLRWLVLMAGVLLVIGPWLIRNHQEMGRITISTNGGVDFYAGNHPSGKAEPQFIPSGLPWDTTRNEAQLDMSGYARGWRHIRQHPLAFVVGGFRKIVFMMTSDTGPFTYELFMMAQSGKITRYFWYAACTQSFYFVFLVFVGLGIIALPRNRSRHRPGGFLLLLIIMYWLAVHFVFFGIGRFHFPLVPFMAGFAGSALADTARCAAKRRYANMV